MLLNTLLTDYISYIKFEKGLSPRTVEMYQSRARHLLWHWLPENGYPNPDISVFTVPVLRRYLYAQGERGLRPRTIRGMFHPLRSLGDYIVEQGLLTENPVRSLTLPKKDAANRKYVSDQELALMTAAIERLPDAYKVAFLRALFSVLINCGPRAQELLDMRVFDYSRDTKTLVVAHGKGEKARVLHPPAGTVTALDELMIVRGEMGCQHEWLWAITKTRRLGYDGLRRYVDEVKCLAGLKGHDNIHCHSIRRAFAQRMMQRGATIKGIQASLGHSQAETTFVYLNMGEQEARSMSELGALTAKAPAPPPPVHTAVQSAPLDLQRGPVPGVKHQAPDGPGHAIVRTFDRSAFHTHRRRTPAK